MQRHRFTSWLLLFALVVGTVLPVHVGAHALRTDVVGRDFCTTTGTRDAPVAPDRAHADACATCFSCGAGAAAPGVHAAVAPVVPAAWLHAPAMAAADVAAPCRHALARGPPPAA